MGKDNFLSYYTTLEDYLTLARGLAKEYDWEEIDLQDNIGMVSFRKDGVRVNVYYTRKTVATALKHPKKGSTQMFRKNVEPQLLRRIFKYPRTHSGRGYRLRIHKPK